MLPASETTGYFSSTVNFDADAGDGYCIRNVLFMSWVMYATMIFSEFLSCLNTVWGVRFVVVRGP